VLKAADEILITGEALSHCVANSIRDIANNFGDDNIKKFVLLEDTSSNVNGCEKMGQDFVKEMIGRGMKITTTKDW
jgi:nicotinamidase/pyrazinamidase